MRGLSHANILTHGTGKWLVGRRIKGKEGLARIGKREQKGGFYLIGFQCNG